ncbi:MAG: hypothetical protein V2A58_13635 [Planctomycetota bacterium]
MAVFFNRSLSDDVREWTTDERLVIAREAKVQSSTGKGRSKQTKVQDAVAAYVEEPAQTGARTGGPAERWMWAFEDGFIQPFLNANTRIIDRATILRLAAAREGEDSALQPVAAKHIEMEALKDHADLFVEILIARSPAALYGYDFRASAKEVRTGRIVASVSSLRWRPEDRGRKVVVATSEGYQIVPHMPPVEDIASDLAVDLMNALLRAWED